MLVLLTDIFVFLGLGGILLFTVVRPRHSTFIDNIHNKHALVYSLSALFLCVLINAWAESIFANHNDSYVPYLRICCCLYSIIVCVFALGIQFGFIRESRLMREKDILERLLRDEEKRYRISKATVESINKKSHDLKNQIAILANIDDKKERRDYINEISQCVSVYENTARTGNAALDIVLSEKGLLCEKNNISLSYLVDAAKISFMTASDIAILFGNAMDNAIECLLTEDADRRFISITVKEKLGFIYIHMDNYCTKKLTFKNGFPQTRKEDRENHGFGTRSIESIVLKYGGRLNMELRDDRFNLDVVLPAPTAL